jgi:hypothetical protein
MVYEKAVSGDFAAVILLAGSTPLLRAPRECVVREQGGHHQGKGHTVAVDESAFVPDGRRDRRERQSRALDLRKQRAIHARQFGFTAKTFKAGDEVTVVMSAVAKNGTPAGRITRVILADGYVMNSEVR